MYIFNTTPVYEANRNSAADIVVNQGGTDSSKTYSIMQLLVEIATTTYPPKEDPIITVLSTSVPNAKRGAWRVMQSLMQSEGIHHYVRNINEGDRIVYFTSGWIMEFRPAIDEQDAKQGKRQYLFVNEADGIPWMIFWQMAKRTRVRTFIDYNPSAPFWAHEKLIGTLPEANDLSASVQLIISDHRHNTFLSDKEHARTEGIKHPELWRVYARGLTGNLSGLIYPTFKMIPDNDYPWDAPGKFGGLDFGYTNDPTAGVRMVKVANKVYVHELCYESPFTARQIKDTFKAQGFGAETPIYCDHDNEMINQLRRLNLLALPARKGPGSIAPGILKVNEYDVYYTASSINIDFEKKRYMWLKDSKTGKFVNEPADGYDHLMDAIRYGITSKFYRGRA